MLEINKIWMEHSIKLILFPRSWRLECEFMAVNNSSVENSKIAFQEEFSFQIYDSFSTNTKKNGSFLVSSINTKIGVIFQGLVDKFCTLEQRKKFLLCTVPFFLVECPREAHVFPTSPTSPCLSLFLLLPPHTKAFSPSLLSPQPIWASERVWMLVV